MQWACELRIPAASVGCVVGMGHTCCLAHDCLRAPCTQVLRWHSHPDVRLQADLNSAATAAREECVFTADVLMGLDCQRGQLQDVCWSLSVKNTDHKLSDSGCVGPTKRNMCAQSNFTAYVFEVLGGAAPTVGAAWPWMSTVPGAAAVLH